MGLDNLPGLVASNGYTLKSIFSEKIGLKIGHLNAQSMNPRNVKFAEIYDFLIASDFDVICVSETWWSDSITESSVSLPGYKLFRGDRLDRMGGGVAIYVSCKFKSSLVRFKSNPVPNEQYEFLAVKMDESNICISAAYIPPNSGLQFIEEDVSFICNTFDYRIFVGDLNWNVFNKNSFGVLSDFLLRNDLSIVHNDLPTHYDQFHGSCSLLDYFLVSDQVSVLSKAQVWLPAIISKHAFIGIQVLLPTKPNKVDRVISYRDFKSIDVNRLFEDVANLDLSMLYTTNDSDFQLELINNSILSLLNKYAPVKCVLVSNKHKFPFMKSRDIVVAKEMRQLAYKSFHKEPIGREKDRLKSIYNQHRNNVTKLIRRKKKEHGFKIFNNNCSVKKAWSILKENGVDNGKNDIPDSISLDDLNIHFTHCNTNPTTNLDSNMPDRVNEFGFNCISRLDLWSAIHSISSNAVGHDLIPPVFLKLIFNGFGNHLVYLFNTIISTCKFPSSWKIALVTPLPKIKSPKVVSDFRPI